MLTQQTLEAGLSPKSIEECFCFVDSRGYADTDMWD